jgi:Icc-related predicted phosphoesterase
MHDRVQVPDGDVLIHAGDFMDTGRNPTEATGFFAWFEAQPHKHKIVIAGNHDVFFEQYNDMARRLVPTSVHYLEDSGVEIEGIKFWGSPVQPVFFDWAFNRERGFAIRQHWRMIPEDTQVLITHGPPDGVLDETPNGTHVGCFDLTRRLEALNDLKLHVFGHIHHSYGRRDVKDLTFVNAAVCNERYRPINAPQVIEL